MNHSDQRQPPPLQNWQQQPGIASLGQMPYQPTTAGAGGAQSTVDHGAQVTAVSSSTQAPTAFLPQQQLAFHQAQQFQNQKQQQQLQAFWANQMQEAEQTADFKNHSLPLARIKKIMKADEDVRMISAEAPVVFAKACEMFILELTMRSWIRTEENKRRTLQKNDIAGAISRTDVFDFLVDIIPRDELREDGIGITEATIPLIGSQADGASYYYVPPHLPSLDQVALGRAEQSRPPLSFMAWQLLNKQEQQQQQPPEQQPDDP